MAVYHQFHDAYLVGIAIDNEKREIELRITSQTQASRVRLVGVRRLLANEVKEGNIILVVEVISGAEIRQAHFIKWLGELVDPSHDAGKATIAQIEREDLALFVLQPSYGAEVFCLCERAEVLEDRAA